MLFQLLLLFTLIPLIELAVMIKVGGIIGIGPTIAMVLAAGVLGAALARHEGLRTLHGVQADVAAGRVPGDRIIDALLILVAGVLLIAPGFVTDLIGVLLLIPPVRVLARGYLKKRFVARFTIISGAGPNSGHPRGQDDLIDVEARSPQDSERS
jgi:UPF0716 protein FxsA